MLLFAFYPWKTCLTTCCATAAAMCVAWICFCLYVDHYWETKAQHAETDAEWHDVDSDTSRVFGPIFFGVPFAVGYTLACLYVLAATDWNITLLRRRRTRGVTAT